MTGILRCLQVLKKCKAAACVIQPTCQGGRTLGLHGGEYSPPVTKKMHAASFSLRCPEIVLEGKNATGRSRPGLYGLTDQLSQSSFGLCPQSFSSQQTASSFHFDTLTHLNNRTKTCLLRQVNGFRGLGARLHLQDASSGFQTSHSASFHSSCRLQGRGSDFVQRYRQGLRDVPLPAMMLGLSGLIPFIVPALYTAATCTIGPSLLWAQVAYGASILSFLGGIRWGFALTDREKGPTWSSLGYSVVPSLIAWSGLLMPLQPSQLCIMGGLLIAGAVDAGTNVYPPWFQSLRLLLSLFALLSLGVSYGFCLVFEPTSEAHGSNVYKLIKIVKIILE